MSDQLDEGVVFYSPEALRRYAQEGRSRRGGTSDQLGKVADFYSPEVLLRYANHPRPDLDIVAGVIAGRPYLDYGSGIGVLGRRVRTLGGEGYSGAVEPIMDAACLAGDYYDWVIVGSGVAALRAGCLDLIAGTADHEVVGIFISVLAMMTPGDVQAVLDEMEVLKFRYLILGLDVFPEGYIQEVREVLGIQLFDHEELVARSLGSWRTEVVFHGEVAKSLRTGEGLELKILSFTR